MAPRTPSTRLRNILPQLARRGLVAMAVTGTLSSAAMITGQVRADDPVRPPSEVSRLIEDLGSESYATRTRARERLQRMGLEAFDELHVAQYHPDIEIEMAARFLVSSLLVSWSKESDDPIVREALHEYGAQDESERLSRIEMLAEFPNRKGLVALARLARFETSLRLSRRAAMAIMQQPMSEQDSVRSRNAEQVLETLGGNNRQAAEWLRAYAKDLPGGSYSASRWRDLVRVQRDEIDSASSQASTRESVLELVRICATRAGEAGQQDEAIRLAAENIDLIEPTTRHLIDACSWAIDNQLHPFVLKLRNQFPAMFDQQPILLYGAAEAETVAGNLTKAEQLADTALAIRPLPRTEEEKKKMSPRDIEEAAQAHREIGLNLQQRGLFAWAEREFLTVIDALEIDSAPAATARGDLAAMLAERLEHDRVVEVLEPLVERVDLDDKFKQRLNGLFSNYSRTESDLYYHQGLSLIEKGNLDEARPLLMRAYRLYESNIDILITMYRIEGDKEWNSLIKTMLERAINQSESQIRGARIQLRNQGRAGDAYIAELMNQYAWLVSNTEGDYAKALEYSLKSLEMSPDGAKYDTCGRCYFAVEDFENAVLMQKRALKYMPHSPPLVRQLEQFEAAREEAREKAREKAAAKPE